tara:strand:+ start:1753 stop:1890 length:138 start_codon:yes stop_codon:yes gene_type:complete
MPKEVETRMIELMATFAISLLTKEQFEIVKSKTVERMKIEGFKDE